MPLLPDVPALILETIAAYAQQGCMPDDMPIDRAHALTNTFAVAFLESIFRGGQMIDPATTAIPDDIMFAGRVAPASPVLVNELRRGAAVCSRERGRS